MSSRSLKQFAGAHLLTVTGEWAAVVAVLIHAYSWGESQAVGFVSLAVLGVPLLASPWVPRLLCRASAHQVRVAGFSVQLAAFAASAVAAAAGAGTPVVAAGVVLALAALSTLRPTGAMLLPAIARSTGELTRGNLWLSYSDSASGLLGPLMAAALASMGGTTAVFVGCAVASGLALLLTVAYGAPTVSGPRGATSAHKGALRETFRELREHPWTLGIFGASAARNILLGSFDVLVVVIALQELQLDNGGTSLLSALLGAGALVSTLLLTAVVKRSKVRWAIVGALAASSVACVVIAASTTLPVVYLVLPVVGLCLSTIENLSRLLLQRSTDPRRLGTLFSSLALVSAASQVLGVLITQGLLALGGPVWALIGIAVVPALVLAASRVALRDADAKADVPVVEMALLTGVPMLAVLPQATLEMIARSAVFRDCTAGTNVVTQGETGDVFYTVADGTFEVVMTGKVIRTATRGDFFGEVALLQGVPRTATVRACTDGNVLGIHRGPFLYAITGHEVAQAAATNHVRGLEFEEGMLGADAPHRSAT